MEHVTHNVIRFTIEKPAGYTFIPGHATEVAVNKPGWEKKKHPFTFTSLNDWPTLEFTIKIYPERHGVTDQLSKLVPGDELIIHDVWGAIEYKGPGVFIAGGAGITPFIAILRHLYQNQQLRHCTLIFSNKTTADIIIKDELEQMLGSNLHNVITEEEVNGQPKQRIDQEYLKNAINNLNQHFYICGPDVFVAEINGILISIGIAPDNIVHEK
jgi:ferredoxin-NADP reductase